MGSHRRLVPSGFDRGARGAALCVLAAAAAALGILPAGAAPQDDRRAEVNRLYAEAEHATESYNRADERADLLHDQVDEAQDHIARQQDRINTMRSALGSLAGAQYRSGGLDPSLALMFSDDPDEYLDKAAAIDRISARQAGELEELQTALRVLAQDRVEATRKLSELDRSRQAVARHKRTVERKLARARQLLNAMPDEDRAAHDRASRSPRTPDLTGAAPASGRAAAAVAAARSAVGRPYVWGASGPATFDCSGLTQWSYAQAGVGLPRTSQAQAHAGRRVPLAQAQPGDLVTYRDDASHVGMYVGNGQVIHAPYPGAPVRYDPVGMMPVSAVTRP